MEGYSKKCKDLTTRFDSGTKQCVPCEKPKPGRGLTPNCGYDDNKGRHVPSTKSCGINFFNDGSKDFCQPCTSCPTGFQSVSPCNATTDTQCQDLRSLTTEDPARETTTTTTIATTSQRVSTFFSKASTIQTKEESSLTPHATNTPTKSDPVATSNDVPWALHFAILIAIMLVALFGFIIYMKRKKGRNTSYGTSLTRRSSCMNVGFYPLSALPESDLEDILRPDIISAPLQTVLDNLDVLEELVILLDPESHGVKNTKHLASHCSFPSTWITYTYSMKDSKSPLKAVLEGVTSRHPDWTVGHLAKLLRHIERNDAIAPLAKLRFN
ncbi:IGF-like family receptor 1 isoform X1 [Thunnus albacares]|uniref:IGF-like family receptor 1 isoform X1 n=1 Tax=Thunnus albacares TaxID=8236 RepID=UPI001CF695F9|nr:IGF-like family receptor 1 isoform X1 [Thunnus albacares]XP_044214673.1 IGF-like family receptor 1 isoform X1 [Thunnus albacares]